MKSFLEYVMKKIFFSFSWKLPFVAYWPVSCDLQPRVHSRQSCSLGPEWVWKLCCRVNGAHTTTCHLQHRISSGRLWETWCSSEWALHSFRPRLTKTALTFPRPCWREGTAPCIWVTSALAMQESMSVIWWLGSQAASRGFSSRVCSSLFSVRTQWVSLMRSLTHLNIYTCFCFVFCLFVNL